MKTHLWLGSLQLFVGIGAVPAGIALIAKPDGSSLGMSLEMLSASPFESFLIPGILLLFVNGLLHLAAAVASFRKGRYAARAGMVLGIALAIWIAVQIYYINPVNWLQVLYLLLGITELALGVRLHTRVRPV